MSHTPIKTLAIRRRLCSQTLYPTLCNVLSLHRTCSVHKRLTTTAGARGPSADERQHPMHKTLTDLSADETHKCLVNIEVRSTGHTQAVLRAASMFVQILASEPRTTRQTTNKLSHDSNTMRRTSPTSATRDAAVFRPRNRNVSAH
eukprot:6188569-Pleurochrysis_carterae.AAC.1